MFNFRDILDELEDEHREKKVSQAPGTTVNADRKAFDLPTQSEETKDDKRKNAVEELLNNKKEKDPKKKSGGALLQALLNKNKNK